MPYNQILYCVGKVYNGKRLWVVRDNGSDLVILDSKDLPGNVNDKCIVFSIYSQRFYIGIGNKVYCYHIDNFTLVTSWGTNGYVVVCAEGGLVRRLAVDDSDCLAVTYHKSGDNSKVKLYNSNGNLLWTKTANYIVPYWVDFDLNGNIYFGGAGGFGIDTYLLRRSDGATLFTSGVSETSDGGKASKRNEIPNWLFHVHLSKLQAWEVTPPNKTIKWQQSVSLHTGPLYVDSLLLTNLSPPRIALTQSPYKLVTYKDTDGEKLNEVSYTVSHGAIVALRKHPENQIYALTDKNYLKVYSPSLILLRQLQVISSSTQYITAFVKVDTVAQLTGNMDGQSEISGKIKYDNFIFRNAFIPYKPQNDIQETLEWNTDILKSLNGSEQRIKLRNECKQYFKLKILLDSDKKAAWYDSLLFAKQKEQFAIPIWTEKVIDYNNINEEDDEIYCDTRFADFRNSSYGLIWKNENEYEIILISDVKENYLELLYPVVNSYSGKKYIMPLRIGWMVVKSDKRKYNSEVYFVEFIFSVYDTINFDDYEFGTTYDELGVLTIPSFMEDSFNESSDGDINLKDYNTGIFEVESDSLYNIVSQNHHFINDVKEDCWNFRKFLHYLNGKQKIILVPSFKNELIQVSIINPNDINVTVENIQLYENMGFNNLRTYIGFLLNDNSLLIRKITAIYRIDNDKERIYFNSSLGQTINPEDCKIFFVDKCRLADNRIEINWIRSGYNECKLDFIRIVE